MTSDVFLRPCDLSAFAEDYAMCLHEVLDALYSRVNFLSSIQSWCKDLLPQPVGDVSLEGRLQSVRSLLDFGKADSRSSGVFAPIELTELGSLLRFLRANLWLKTCGQVMREYVISLANHVLHPSVHLLYVVEHARSNVMSFIEEMGGHRFVLSYVGKLPGSQQRSQPIQVSVAEEMLEEEFVPNEFFPSPPEVSILLERLKTPRQETAVENVEEQASPPKVTKQSSVSSVGESRKASTQSTSITSYPPQGSRFCELMERLRSVARRRTTCDNIANVLEYGSDCAKVAVDVFEYYGLEKYAHPLTIFDAMAFVNLFRGRTVDPFKRFLSGAEYGLVRKRLYHVMYRFGMVASKNIGKKVAKEIDLRFEEEWKNLFRSEAKLGFWLDNASIRKVWFGQVMAVFSFLDLPMKIESLWGSIWKDEFFRDGILHLSDPAQRLPPNVRGCASLDENKLSRDGMAFLVELQSMTNYGFFSGELAGESGESISVLAGLLSGVLHDTGVVGNDVLQPLRATVKCLVEGARDISRGHANSEHYLMLYMIHVLRKQYYDAKKMVVQQWRTSDDSPSKHVDLQKTAEEHCAALAAHMHERQCWSILTVDGYIYDALFLHLAKKRDSLQWLYLFPGVWHILLNATSKILFQGKPIIRECAHLLDALGNDSDIDGVSILSALYGSKTSPRKQFQMLSSLFSGCFMGIFRLFRVWYPHRFVGGCDPMISFIGCCLEFADASSGGYMFMRFLWQYGVAFMTLYCGIRGGLGAIIEAGCDMASLFCMHGSREGIYTRLPLWLAVERGALRPEVATCVRCMLSVNGEGKMCVAIDEKCEGVNQEMKSHSLAINAKGINRAKAIHDEGSTLASKMENICISGAVQPPHGEADDHSDRSQLRIPRYDKACTTSWLFSDAIVAHFELRDGMNAVSRMQIVQSWRGLPFRAVIEGKVSLSEQKMSAYEKNVSRRLVQRRYQGFLAMGSSAYSHANRTCALGKPGKDTSPALSAGSVKLDNNTRSKQKKDRVREQFHQVGKLTGEVSPYLSGVDQQWTKMTGEAQYGNKASIRNALIDTLSDVHPLNHIPERQEVGYSAFAFDLPCVTHAMVANTKLDLVHFHHHLLEHILNHVRVRVTGEEHVFVVLAMDTSQVVRFVHEEDMSLKPIYDPKQQCYPRDFAPRPPSSSFGADRCEKDATKDINERFSDEMLFNKSLAQSMVEDPEALSKAWKRRLWNMLSWGYSFLRAVYKNRNARAYAWQAIMTHAFDLLFKGIPCFKLKQLIGEEEKSKFTFVFLGGCTPWATVVDENSASLHKKRRVDVLEGEDLVVVGLRICQQLSCNNYRLPIRRMVTKGTDSDMFYKLLLSHARGIFDFSRRGTFEKPILFLDKAPGLTAMCEPESVVCMNEVLDAIAGNHKFDSFVCDGLDQSPKSQLIGKVLSVSAIAITMGGDYVPWTSGCGPAAFLHVLKSGKMIAPIVAFDRQKGLCKMPADAFLRIHFLLRHYLCGRKEELLSTSMANKEDQMMFRITSAEIAAQPGSMQPALVVGGFYTASMMIEEMVVYQWNVVGLFHSDERSMVNPAAWIPVHQATNFMLALNQSGFPAAACYSKRAFCFNKNALDGRDRWERIVSCKADGTSVLSYPPQGGFVSCSRLLNATIEVIRSVHCRCTGGKSGLCCGEKSKNCSCRKAGLMCSPQCSCFRSSKRRCALGLMKITAAMWGSTFGNVTEYRTATESAPNVPAVSLQEEEGQVLETVPEVEIVLLDDPLEVEVLARGVVNNDPNGSSSDQSRVAE